jgi:hypothetical protein
MSKGKNLTLEEARRTGQLERFWKENPSKAHRRTFERALDAMSRGVLEAKETSQPDRASGSSGTRTPEDNERGGGG